MGDYDLWRVKDNRPDDRRLRAVDYVRAVVGDVVRVEERLSKLLRQASSKAAAGLAPSYSAVGSKLRFVGCPLPLLLILAAIFALREHHECACSGELRISNVLKSGFSVVTGDDLTRMTYSSSFERKLMFFCVLLRWCPRSADWRRCRVASVLGSALDLRRSSQVGKAEPVRAAAVRSGSIVQPAQAAARSGSVALPSPAAAPAASALIASAPAAAAGAFGGSGGSSSPLGRSGSLAGVIKSAFGATMLRRPSPESSPMARGGSMADIMGLRAMGEDRAEAAQLLARQIDFYKGPRRPGPLDSFVSSSFGE